MGLRMKNFNILGIHRRIRLLGGNSGKIDIEGGDSLKRGGFDSFQIFKKVGGGVFERRIDTSCTL